MTRQVKAAAAIGLMLVLLFTSSPRSCRLLYPENTFLAVIRECVEEQRHYTPVPPTLAKYEQLLRDSARSIDWDWRLVASIVYHESRFNNDAQSDKGATGLMQIHSSRYSRDTLLIPAVNLSIGTAYLRKLENMFEAATPMDSLKFALAAFNLGDGKVRRLTVEARSAGLDPTRWDEVARLLPQGHHTVSYVNKVLETFDQYSRLYPR